MVVLHRRERLKGILYSNPPLEASIILRIAVKDRDVMDVIEERASMNWEAGYSDSLYMAVLGSITSTGEMREYSDKPDEQQAAFMRRMGIAEADIKDRVKSPSVWVKRKPMTDWEAEKQKYVD